MKREISAFSKSTSFRAEREQRKGSFHEKGETVICVDSCVPKTGSSGLLERLVASDYVPHGIVVSASHMPSMLVQWFSVSEASDSLLSRTEER
jgi:hypothetical protein